VASETTPRSSEGGQHEPWAWRNGNQVYKYDDSLTSSRAVESYKARSDTLTNKSALLHGRPAEAISPDKSPVNVEREVGEQLVHASNSQCRGPEQGSLLEFSEASSEERAGWHEVSAASWRDLWQRGRERRWHFPRTAAWKRLQLPLKRVRIVANAHVEGVSWFPDPLDPLCLLSISTASSICLETWMVVADGHLGESMDGNGNLGG